MVEGQMTSLSYRDLIVSLWGRNILALYIVYFLIETSRMEFAISIHEAYIVEPFTRLGEYLYFLYTNERDLITPLKYNQTQPIMMEKLLSFLNNNQYKKGK